MAEEKALISVIVPVYKVEKYLDRCVRSILAQTYENLEVILVDDGSPDRSGELCDGFAAEDPRVRVIHQENGGVSAARNAGLAVMKGLYFAFVDSDDYIEPEMVEKLYVAIEHNNAELAICGINRVTLNGEDLWEAKPLLVSGKIDIAKYFAEHFLEWIACSPCAKLYRSDVRGNLQFDEEISLGEDLKFNIEYIAGIESVVTISPCLYSYMDCTGSLTRTHKRENYDAICNVYEVMMAYLKSAIPATDKVDVTKVNYKLFAHCCVFMARNIPVSDWKSEWEFIKEICENPLVQQAVRGLPEVPLPHRICAWAIMKKHIFCLEVLAFLKQKIVK